MGLKALGKLFMGLGIGLLVYGLAMDTSVSTDHGRVVNIGLANDRLIFILMGGFVFVGGIILYAVFKAKQTKEDALVEQQESEARLAERKAHAAATSKALSAKVAKDNIIWRLVHGLGVALLVTGLADLVHPPTAVIILVYVVSIGLAFRAMDYRIAISQCWLFAAIAMAYLCAHTIFIGKIVAWTLLIPAAGIFYLLSRRYQKN